MAEAWDDGSTTIAIKTLDTYTCQVDFQYSFQQGVKIRDVSSVCSGSSSQSNNDVIDKLGNHKFSLKTSEGIELECEVGAVLLEDSKSLSEEVLTSSLKCEVVEADCVTVEGDVYPAQCVIPFNYKGRRYLGCTDRPGSTKLWCPTQTDKTGEAEDKFWGYCSRKCGYCGGSPITTRDGQEESCGYDCLLGADWDMVGYDKAPLLKPTIDVSLPTESNYIEEKGGQHQLNIGPQSVTISCPETKFYDPALQQETKLNVQCGPQKYRMTVTTDSGATLGENFKNDQFGCDPCPSSYYYVPGFLPSGDFSSNGNFYDVKTVQDCKTLCEESCVCQTFDYSKQQSRCQLIKELITKSSFSSSIGDYVLCAKGEDENQCGTNSGLDKTNLIAEKNWPYISTSLNQTGHPNQAYRTHVFEVVTENGDIVMTSTNCPLSDPGLVSLFIAPSSSMCNAGTLGSSSSTNGLHHLMISTSCNLDTAIQKFISDKDKFKQYFNGVPIKLCGARTWMKSVVAESRKTTLMDVFSFLYNTEATAASFDLDDASDCKTKEETIKTLKSMVDTSEDVGFVNENDVGTEIEGFIEVPLIRTATEKIGIAFVETEFKSEEGQKTSTIEDIIPYSGLVTFPANSDSGLLFITVIRDNITEQEEFFKIKLVGGNKRMAKANTGPSNTDGGDKTKCSQIQENNCKPRKCFKIKDKQPICFSVCSEEYSKGCESVPGKPVCLSNKCKECEINTNRGCDQTAHPGKPVCDGSKENKCVLCTINPKDGCPKEEFCKDMVRCVECVNQQNCKNKPKKNCQENQDKRFNNQCVECLKIGDCMDPEKSTCKLVDGPDMFTCVQECTTETCKYKTGFIKCATEGKNKGKCVPCTQDDHCPRTGMKQADVHAKCDPDTNTCLKGITIFCKGTTYWRTKDILEEPILLIYPSSSTEKDAAHFHMDDPSNFRSVNCPYDQNRGHDDYVDQAGEDTGLKEAFADLVEACKVQAKKLQFTWSYNTPTSFYNKKPSRPNQPSTVKYTNYFFIESKVLGAGGKDYHMNCLPGYFKL